MAKKLVRTKATPTRPSGIIDKVHTTIIKNHSFVGSNVYSLDNLDLLVEWWNFSEHLQLNTKQLVSWQDRELMQFHAAVWIRINELHPKALLRFDDIRK